MHQIAKINHCETSILGGNGITVKLRTLRVGGLSEYSDSQELGNSF
jgi:hypothetical protein